MCLKITCWKALFLKKRKKKKEQQNLILDEPGELWNLGIVLQCSVDTAEIQDCGSHHYFLHRTHTVVAGIF